MKKLFKYALLFFAAVVMTSGLTACSDDDDKGNTPPTSTVGNTAYQPIINQYLNAVVYPTYASLASETNDLYNELYDLKEKFKKDASSVQQSEIDAVCTSFKNARAYWERSEAFLYGPATMWGIDPHIDAWPLDLSKLAVQLAQKQVIAQLDGEDGPEQALALVGSSNLGFHGIEFILFRDGKNRTVAALQGNEDNSDFLNANGNAEVSGLNELIFATAVAGDLRNYCYELNVSWNPNAPAAQKELVEDELEMNTSLPGNDYYYGQNMLEIGNASTYRTWNAAMMEIMNAGCSNIANEVANTKMGRAYNGSTQEDRDYIESPYSQRSFYDFEDNIISVRNSLYGSLDGTINSTSIMAILQKNNATLAASLQQKLDASIKALQTCQSKQPFVLAPHTAEVKTAMDAINALNDELLVGETWFSKN